MKYQNLSDLLEILGEQFIATVIAFLVAYVVFILLLATGEKFMGSTEKGYLLTKCFMSLLSMLIFVALGYFTTFPEWLFVSNREGLAFLRENAASLSRILAIVFFGCAGVLFVCFIVLLVMFFKHDPYALKERYEIDE